VVLTAGKWSASALCAGADLVKSYSKTLVAAFFRHAGLVELCRVQKRNCVVAALRLRRKTANADIITSFYFSMLCVGANAVSTHFGKGRKIFLTG
jgi:hypothetical protein